VKQSVDTAYKTKSNRKTAFVGFRLLEPTIKSVDRWGKQYGLNRSQAPRELIEQALKSAKR
jgi:hypothetical protein